MAMSGVMIFIFCVTYIFHVLWYAEFRSKLNLNTLAVLLMPIAVLGSGFLCGKVLAFLEFGDFGGRRIFGVIFFTPIVIYLGAKLFKRNVADVFDIVTIPIIFSLGFAKINCLYCGCCLGLLIPGTDGMRWPTSILEMLFSVVLIIVLDRKMGKDTYNGKIYPLYMMVYGIYRFVIEWITEPHVVIGWLHLEHILSIIAFMTGAFIYIRIMKREKESKNKKKEERKK